MTSGGQKRWSIIARWALGLVVLVVVLVLAASPGRGEGTGAPPNESDQFSTGLPGNVEGVPHNPEIWRHLRRGGRGTVATPDRTGGTLIQPSGAAWQKFHEDQLPRLGAWALAGISTLLGIFFLLRGRIRIDAWFSGRTLLRFRTIERTAHWLLAASFIILAVTGLNMVYGNIVLKPLVGYETFATLTAYGKWLHDYASFAFMAGLVMIVLLWARDNIPERCDLIWLARGGGLFSKHDHPPARRFNAGQKFVFWSVVLCGVLISITGLCLLAPFTFAPFSGILSVFNAVGVDVPASLSPVEELQLALVWHGILAIVMMVVVIAHVYIGSLGMEGAFDAMASGHVDENWARQHHCLWVESLIGNNTSPPADHSATSVRAVRDASTNAKRSKATE